MFIEIFICFFEDVFATQLLQGQIIKIQATVGYMVAQKLHC